jgi:hypothetical protein
MNPLPTSREAWLTEIARALRDSSEAIPFGPLAGASFGAAELFHLGPVTALKFRGIRRSKRVLRQITEAALVQLYRHRKRGLRLPDRSSRCFRFHLSDEPLRAQPAN